MEEELQRLQQANAELQQRVTTLEKEKGELNERISDLEINKHNADGESETLLGGCEYDY